MFLRLTMVSGGVLVLIWFGAWLFVTTLRDDQPGDWPKGSAKKAQVRRVLRAAAAVSVLVAVTAVVVGLISTS